MAAKTHLFTSESVTEGHPDKLADQISDAVLDALLAKDPQSRVACETSVTTGLVVIIGETSSEAQIAFTVGQYIRQYREFSTADGFASCYSCYLMKERVTNRRES